MNCETCKACDRVKDINGLLGSMDCDKTPDKLRWLVNIHLVYGWAIMRLRTLNDMMLDRLKHPDMPPVSAAYIMGERDKIDNALKEQYDKEPR